MFSARCKKAVSGPIFANTAGHPLDLNACYQREMKDVLKRAGIFWHGWHGFRRGLASNLNRLGVDDFVIQRILRHSRVATTQSHYIKDRIARCDRSNEAVLRSLIVLHLCPGESLKAKGSVQ
jgi:integrase